jgi:hypothetical protein
MTKTHRADRKKSMREDIMTCMLTTVWRNVCRRVPIGSLIALVLVALGSVASLQAQEPIKIGFSVSLTGGLASSGKAHLLSKLIR